jgi:hypothetical protein
MMNSWNPRSVGLTQQGRNFVEHRIFVRFDFFDRTRAAFDVDRAADPAAVHQSVVDATQLLQMSCLRKWLDDDVEVAATRQTEALRFFGCEAITEVLRGVARQNPGT